MSSVGLPEEVARVRELDGVRALAVIGVIASHSGLFNLGWIGVDVFFGLSGYLITGILLDAKVPGVVARQYFGSFYMRRALRILPLAWAFLVIVCIYRDEWRGFGWYLGYAVNWLPASPPPRDLGHYWSLAVEEQFYLFWPALVFFASRAILLRATLLLIALDVILRLAVSLWMVDSTTEQFRDLASFARADTLLVGALLAQRERSGGWGREVQWALPVALLAFAGIVAIRYLENHGAPDPITYNLKWPLIAVAVGASLLVVLTRPPRALRWGWLVWIGKVSYGVYVIHAVFGRWLHQRYSLEQAPIIFLVQLGVTLPLAALSWYCFESPILRFKRSWPMPSRERPRLGSPR